MSTQSSPAGQDFLLAPWTVRAVGAVIDAVVVGVPTFLIAVSAGVRSRTSFAYLDLAVSFSYSFVLIGFFSHTLGMSVMKLDAVDATQGRSPIGSFSAAIRSATAGVLSIFPPIAILDLLWPIWDSRTRRSTTRLPAPSCCAG